MAQQGLSCRGLAAEMGQSKSSVAGKVNGSLHWQQADLVWLYRMKGLPSDFVLGNDAALVNRLLSPPDKRRFRALGAEPNDNRRRLRPVHPPRFPAADVLYPK